MPCNRTNPEHTHTTSRKTHHKNLKKQSEKKDIRKRNKDDKDSRFLIGNNANKKVVEQHL